MAFSIFLPEVFGMYVCVCNAVTDKEVAQAIEGGAKTRAEVTRACGAGGDCGSCHGMIDEMLTERGQPGVVPAACLVRGRAA
jgi:bacterioferritin-associated ferredoxin